MAVEFIEWRPRYFNLPDKAKEFLYDACQRTQLSVITLEETIEQASKGKCSIYLVYKTKEHSPKFASIDLVGCLTLSLRETERDLFLELPLMGGEDLRSWRDDLVDFLFQKAEQHKCTRFTMIGRKGFERLFPEMKLLCCVYGRNLTEAL